ncbi:MAG: hypothetical protein L6Q29_03980 [Candidatus Pacebacteria bacterium]|nr:hypothetical protein [Candidatus Paceibacterota bacterium]
MNKILKITTSALFLAVVIIPSFSLAQTSNMRMRNLATTTNATQSVNIKRLNINLSCMADAIEKRDNALIAALDAKNNSLKAALTARKNSLSDAWRNMSGITRYRAIREVWKNYGNSVKQTQKESKNNREAAWKQFEKEKRSCKADLRATVDKTDSSVDSNL